MIIDLRDTHIRLVALRTSGIRVKFDYPQDNPLSGAWMRFLTHMGEEGAVDGPQLANDSPDSMDIDLPISSTESYYNDRYIFEGYGHVLGRDQVFSVEMFFDGRITIALDEGGGIILELDPLDAVAPGRLPLPPRTAWDRLDDLDPISAAPSPSVDVLAPGWGDDFC